MTASTKSLSLALIVKNEARCLARCLRSVRSIVDEIVVVDTGSDDNSKDIARAFNARVTLYAWTDDFAAARNHAITQTTGDWILMLDADEHASPALSSEITAFIHQGPAIGRLRIVSDFRRNGQVLRSQSFVSRLFPRGTHFEGRIHEQVVSPLPRLNLHGELWHDGYLTANKTDRNIKLLLRELELQPQNAYLNFQLAVEHASLDQIENAFACLERAISLMKPTDPFAPNVVVDYLYAAIQLKRFEAGLKVMESNDAYLEDFPDYHLVRGLFFLHLVRSNPAKHLTHLPKIEQSFQHCLALGDTDNYRSVRGTGSFLASYNLGAFYQVFGNLAGARLCYETAAQQGYQPAATMLQKLGPDASGRR